MIEKLRKFRKDNRGVVAIFNMLITIGIAIAVIFVIFGVVIPQIGDQSEDSMSLTAGSNWAYIQTNMSANVLSWVGSVNLVVIIALLSLVIMAVAGMMVYRGRGGAEGGI